MICSQAPTRISFAGGGTDVPEIAAQIGGCVTSAAISRYVRSSIEERSDGKTCIRSAGMDGTEEALLLDTGWKHDGRMELVKSAIEEFGISGVNITIASEVPGHSGLGASASAYAALIAAFACCKNVSMSKKEIAELSFRLEREKLRNCVGKQDQYAACYGGINYMEFSRDMNVDVFPVRMIRTALAELENSIALFHVSGRAKRAGDVIRSQAGSGNKAAFIKTKELGAKARDALAGGDMEGFGKVMGLVWEYKRKFSPETTTPFIEKIHAAALKNGAYGGKISGAGSGGCGFWFCRPGTKDKVIAALEGMGARHLDFKFDFEGVKTWST